MAYLDVEYEARTNPEFRSKLNHLISQLSKVEAAVRVGAARATYVKQLLHELIRHTNYNTALFLPYFFPVFENNTPMSLRDRPFAYSMYDLSPGGALTVRGSRQISKEQPYSALVLTPRGWKRMGDLVVGEKIIGGDGRPCRVHEIIEQGESDVYELEFTDKSTAECGWQHNWLIKRAGPKPWHVETLAQIVARSGFEPYSDVGVRIPLVRPIQLPKRRHLIHPYLLGLLLGNGTLGSPSYSSEIRLSTNDPVILDTIHQLHPDLRIVQRASNDYAILNGVPYERAGIRYELQRLQLLNCDALAKFVPEEYLLDSADNRLALLRGLMDTNGTIAGKCQMTFSSISRKLSEAVVWLVQSLGGTAYIKTWPTYYTKNGGRVDCHPFHTVKLKLKYINPFLLKRKADKFYPIRYENTRVLKRVRKVRREISRCIVVDSPDQTYVTNNCIVTHNSTNFSARNLMLTEIIPGYRIHYITPHNKQLQTFAYKLREVERKFRFFQPPQNLYRKEFRNGSTIKMDYVLTSADSVRGNTADELQFDEYQHFDISLELEVAQIQVASDMPTRIYAGTSLTTDTALETRYLNSSRGVWMLKCGCGYELNFGDRKVVLDFIQERGVTCPKCSRIQNVRTGHWVHESPTMLAKGFPGFHIPQIIVPFFTENARRWTDIYRTKLTADERKVLQEIIGIPTEEGERELTLKDLENICTVNIEAAVKKAKAKQYQVIVSGCDWGGSDYLPAAKTKISYTLHAMLGVNADNTMDILHFRRYSGMDYRSIGQDIVGNHKRLNGELIGSDFGVGSYYNTYIRDNIGSALRHLIFQYAGPSSATVERSQSGGLFNHFLLNRTDTITSLYEAIKRGRLRCFSWEMASEYLLDFMNLFRAPSETASGATSFVYRRHGAKADDALHAVNFAYVLARLYLGEPIVPDRALAREIQNLLRNQGAAAYMDSGRRPGVVSG